MEGNTSGNTSQIPTSSASCTQEIEEIKKNCSYVIANYQLEDSVTSEEWSQTECGKCVQTHKGPTCQAHEINGLCGALPIPPPEPVPNACKCLPSDHRHMKKLIAHQSIWGYRPACVGDSNFCDDFDEQTCEGKAKGRPNGCKWGPVKTV